MSVSFRYPASSSYTDSVDLPNPTLGDSNQITTGAIFKKDMNGDIHSNKRSTLQKLVLNFQTLTLEEKDNFVEFFSAYIGNDILYVDYDSDEWIGKFANTDLIITTNRDDCSYSFQLEFYGVMS